MWIHYFLEQSTTLAPGLGPTWMKKVMSAAWWAQCQSRTLREAFADNGVKPVVKSVLVFPQQLHYWMVRPAEDIVKHKKIHKYRNKINWYMALETLGGICSSNISHLHLTAHIVIWITLHSFISRNWTKTLWFITPFRTLNYDLAKLWTVWLTFCDLSD